jgi:hypothetical protein
MRAFNHVAVHKTPCPNLAAVHVTLGPPPCWCAEGASLLLIVTEPVQLWRGPNRACPHFYREPTPNMLQTNQAPPTPPLNMPQGKKFTASRQLFSPDKEPRTPEKMFEEPSMPEKVYEPRDWQKELEIAYILKRRWNTFGTVDEPNKKPHWVYTVVWLGWGWEHNTEEPLENLKGACCEQWIDELIEREGKLRLSCYKYAGHYGGREAGYPRRRGKTYLSESDHESDRDESDLPNLFDCVPGVRGRDAVAPPLVFRDRDFPAVPLVFRDFRDNH